MIYPINVKKKIKESRHLKENIRSVASVAAWLKDSIAVMTANQELTISRRILDSNFGFYVYWTQGFDINDDSVIHADADKSYGLVAALKCRNDAEWDGEYMDSPYDPKTGDLYCEDYVLSPKDNTEMVAEWLIEDYDSMIELMNNNPDVVIGGLKESKTIKESNDDDKDYYGIHDYGWEKRWQAAYGDIPPSLSYIPQIDEDYYPMYVGKIYRLSPNEYRCKVWVQETYDVNFKSVDALCTTVYSEDDAKSVVQERIKNVLNKIKYNKTSNSSSETDETNEIDTKEIEDELLWRGMRSEYGHYEDTVAFKMCDRAEIMGMNHDDAYKLAWDVVSQMHDKGFEFEEGEALDESKSIKESTISPTELFSTFRSDLESIGFKMYSDRPIIKFKLEKQPEYSLYTKVHLRAQKAGYKQIKVSRDDRERTTYMKSGTLGTLEIIETLVDNSTNIIIVAHINKDVNLYESKSIKEGLSAKEVLEQAKKLLEK